MPATGAPATPDVSVIVGAYNAMPYLPRCLASLAEQSIGHARMEIIAVDDGATDGTGAELDRFAAEHGPLVQVFHQENSGGPSAPRNLALDHARGRYVFFLDADDYLGPEALERMVAAADANGTDVVLGRTVGVGGRRAPDGVFQRGHQRTDVFNSPVYWTLNPMKLFRRELVERHGLRFPTHHTVGEDQHFVALAYLHAQGISVVADYDCHYWVAREDGGNILTTHRDLHERVQVVRSMLDLLEEHVEPGSGRDKLMRRHLVVELREALVHLHREPDRAEREKALVQLRETLERSYHPRLAATLPALVRLRCHLVVHGTVDDLHELIAYELGHGTLTEGITVADRALPAPAVLVEGERAYAQYPFFRDPRRAVPEDCYDITEELKPRHHLAAAELHGTALRVSGHASLPGLDGAGLRAEFVLREHHRGTEHRLVTSPAPVPYDSPGAVGFAAAADLLALPGGGRLDHGMWDLYLELGTGQLTREARLGSQRAPEIPRTPATHLLAAEDGLLPVTLHTTPYGNLTLDVGEQKHGVRKSLRPTTAAWAEDRPATLEISGSCGLAALPPGALHLRLRDRYGTVRDLPVPHGGEFTVAVPLDDLPAGEWALFLHVGEQEGWESPVPAQPALPVARWRRGLARWYAKPLAPQGPKKQRADAPLTLRIDRVRVGKALLARVRR
ncbi:glycosyltransferase family 2 protein [Streptomyces sp. ODS28]|uniref:glycosyltransferase family 2 protein n=1 Tax=Streptomyces sp. ODS28 TaxID=3136688 RepID=UPI0031E708C4